MDLVKRMDGQRLVNAGPQDMAEEWNEWDGKIWFEDLRMIGKKKRIDIFE